MDDNESYYGGGNDAPTATNESEQEDSGEGAEDSNTFLMNSDVCPGMTVGQEGRFKVLRILEKEYECEYLDDQDEENQESDSQPSSDEEMNSYMG